MYRAALVLRHVDGLSVSAVADHLGRTVEATEKVFSRARAAFRLKYRGAIQMSDDLDLSAIDQRHEPDAEFRAALRSRVAAIVENRESSAAAGSEASASGSAVALAPDRGGRRLPIEEITVSENPSTANKPNRRYIAVAAAIIVVGIAGVAFAIDKTSDDDHPAVTPSACHSSQRGDDNHDERGAHDGGWRCAKLVSATA